MASRSAPSASLSRWSTGRVRDCHCGSQRVSGPAAVSEQTATPLQNTGAAIATPPGELRMLEYGQRVTEHRRDALLAEGESSVGEVLFGLATAGGAQALAQPMGAIRPGLRCDLVELDPGHPALIGQIPATILDAWIFSTASDAVVRTVIVGGEIVIRDGHHPLERAARTRVEAVMGRRHSVTAPPA